VLAAHDFSVADEHDSHARAPRVSGECYYILVNTGVRDDPLPLDDLLYGAHLIAKPGSLFKIEAVGRSLHAPAEAFDQVRLPAFQEEHDLVDHLSVKAGFHLPTTWPEATLDVKVQAGAACGSVGVKPVRALPEWE